MKRQFIYLGIITLLSFILTACGTQTDRSDTRENLAELREDMQDVIQSIDEAIATNDISEFKNKTDDAVSSLDNYIDDYLNEMDNADRKIDQNSRNHVIKMKQKKVEIEFKLALLEQDDTDNWNKDHSQRDRSGLTTRTPGTTTGTMVGGGGHTTVDGRDQSRTGVRDQSRIGTDGRTQRNILYGPQLVDDMKNDLRDLKREVEQFMQASLTTYR